MLTVVTSLSIFWLVRGPNIVFGQPPKKLTLALYCASANSGLPQIQHLDKAQTKMVKVPVLQPDAGFMGHGCPYKECTTCACEFLFFYIH